MRNLPSVRPLLSGLLAIAILSVMDAVIKDVRTDLSSPQMVFMRYTFGVLAALPLIPFIVRHGVTWQSLRVNGVRAVTMLTTALLFFFAIGRLPLAYAVALAFSAPIWMAFLSGIMLREPPSGRAIVAIAGGFAGVIAMVIGPRLGAGLEPPDLAGALAALGASFTYALVMILTRKQSAHDPVTVLVGVQTALALVLITPVGIAFWEPIPDDRWLQLFIIGIMGTTGHFFLAYAFSTASAARMAPIEYSGLLWAGALGFFVFGEIPSLWTVFGATLIAAACALVLLERQSGGAAPITPLKRGAADGEHL